MIRKAFQRIVCYIYSQVIKKQYDKKYLCGAWFTGHMRGILSRGWEWVAYDYHLCKKFNVNRNARFPVSPFVRVVCPENIEFHPDDLNNFQGFGNYFQANGRIEIGRGTYIAPNVGIITQNHNKDDPSKRAVEKQVIIGERCWIGMNSMILPGVELGDHTIVGAGSVVTKSFKEGWCTIAGNPAKKISDDR